MPEKYKYDPYSRYHDAVYGSSALEPEEIPAPERRIRKKPVHKKLTKAEKRRLRERRLEVTVRSEPLAADSPAMGLLGFIFLAIGVVIMVCSCVSLVRTGNMISQIKNEIAVQEREYINLKRDNDELEKTIYSEIDLEEIRKTAIEKFGMVYPYDSQVIKYQYNKNGYVRQYSEFVPGADTLTTAVVRDILGK